MIAESMESMGVDEDEQITSNVHHLVLFPHQFRQEHRAHGIWCD